MKKLMNSPESYVDDMLEGLCAAHPSLVRGEPEGRVVRRGDVPGARKVGIVSGGGSGHLPLFTGYVGEALLDACAIGNVFEGPPVDACVSAIKAADGGHGVLLLYGNYGGDRMNFDLASELVLEEGIETRTVLGTDDIASAGPEEREKRRGVAGIIYAYKAAGAKAAQGASLDDVAATAEKVVARTRTIGCAFTSCQLPGAKAPTFMLADDEIEMGMGIHGEPGIWRDKLKPANAFVDEMLQRLLNDYGRPPEQRVSVLVNSLGATPLEELYIFYAGLASRLKERGLEVVQPLIGHFVTSMEMAGVSLSVCFLDDELEALLKAPAACPFWKIG